MTLATIFTPAHILCALVAVVVIALIGVHVYFKRHPWTREEEEAGDDEEQIW